MRGACTAILLVVAGASSAQEDGNWLWQFTDDGEEKASRRIDRALAMDEVSTVDETIRRGATEINRMLQGEGEGEAAGANDKGEVNAPSEVLAALPLPIYEALRGLNPNTLNMTIYWHCISVTYVYLADFGAFQKGDENYQRCEEEGHFLFERSCLHNILVASNCFDGTWNCGPQWVNNVNQALMFLQSTSHNWPQCFTPYSTIESNTLTWDCEERCDLPCTYPDKLCSTIEHSYNSSECRLDCPVGHKRRLRQEKVHDMRLTFGNVNSVAAVLPTPPPTAFATFAPSMSAPSTPSPSTLDAATPTPPPTATPTAHPTTPTTLAAPTQAPSMQAAPTPPPTPVAVTLELAGTSTTIADQQNYHGLTSASARTRLASGSGFIVKIALACFPLIIA